MFRITIVYIQYVIARKLYTAKADYVILVVASWEVQVHLVVTNLFYFIPFFKVIRCESKLSNHRLIEWPFSIKCY